MLCLAHSTIFKYAIWYDNYLSSVLKIYRLEKFSWKYNYGSSIIVVEYTDFLIRSAGIITCVVPMDYSKVLRFKLPEKKNRVSK